MVRTNAEKLQKDINKKLQNWNERSQFKIKGIGNLSRSDLDTLELYAETAIRNEGSGLPLHNGLMKPLGDVRKVLEAYQLVSE